MICCSAWSVALDGAGDADLDLARSLAFPALARLASALMRLASVNVSLDLVRDCLGGVGDRRRLSVRLGLDCDLDLERERRLPLCCLLPGTSWLPTA